MSNATVEGSGDPTLSPIAVEFGVAAAVLVGLYLWRQLASSIITAVSGGLPGEWGLVATSLVHATLFVGGLAAFAIAYVGVRDVEVGLARPTRADRRYVGAALLVPPVLVAVTKLVGVATGVGYNELTLVSVAADPDLRLVAIVAGLGILVTVPTLVLVAQVLLQGGFRRVVGRDAAIGVTTLVTGFALLGGSGGLAIVPDRGKLVAVVLFAATLGVAVYGHRTLAGDRRYLAYTPALVVALLVVVSGIAELETAAGVLFVASHLAVLGVAAFTYDRTDSLLPPAVAYLTLLVANRFVVVVFEAGMQGW